MNQRSTVFSYGAHAAALTVAIHLASSPAALANERPRIVDRPTGDVFSRYYPERAMRLEVGGSVELVCNSTDAGTLTDCKVLHEWPQGFYFGEAALRMASFFHLSGSGVFRTRIAFEPNRDDTLYVLAATTTDNRLPILSRPSPDDMAAAYPGHGMEVIRAGLHCLLTAEGRLDRCEAIKPEQPAEVTAAAQRMAALYRVKSPPAELIGQPSDIYMSFVPPDPHRPPIASTNGTAG